MLFIYFFIFTFDWCKPRCAPLLDQLAHFVFAGGIKFTIFADAKPSVLSALNNSHESSSFVPEFSVTLILAGLLIVLLYRLFCQKSNRHIRLPPGAPALPVIGNLLSLAKEHRSKLFLGPGASSEFQILFLLCYLQ